MKRTSPVTRNHTQEWRKKTRHLDRWRKKRNERPLVIESGGREGGTKLGVHSCRSDLPADNHVAFPQMAYWTSTAVLSNSGKKKIYIYEMHKSRQCDTRKWNLAVVGASLSQASDFRETWQYRNPATGDSFTKYPRYIEKLFRKSADYLSLNITRKREGLNVTPNITWCTIKIINYIRFQWSQKNYMSRNLEINIWYGKIQGWLINEKIVNFWNYITVLIKISLPIAEIKCNKNQWQ